MSHPPTQEQISSPLHPPQALSAAQSSVKRVSEALRSITLFSQQPSRPGLNKDSPALIRNEKKGSFSYTFKMTTTGEQGSLVLKLYTFQNPICPETTDFLRAAPLLVRANHKATLSFEVWICGGVENISRLTIGLVYK